MIPPMTTWYERARRIMRDKHITQESLRKPLGVTTRGAVGHYLTGRRDPSPAQMAALAKALGVSMDTLFGLDGGVREQPPVYQIDGLDKELLLLIVGEVTRTFVERELPMEPERVADLVWDIYEWAAAQEAPPKSAEIVRLVDFALKHR